MNQELYGLPKDIPLRNVNRIWYLRPDCVDTNVFLDRNTEPLIGVGGIDPRQEASVEVGRKACELIVKGMVRKTAALSVIGMLAEYG
ncbi:unnamed protein product [marine sediment metagenome]|uniref:Uncharacterized protein n=1 Tax=marine sediment metagenome TaxID=412755 RepID=X1GQ52_9ZZZZ